MLALLGLLVAQLSFIAAQNASLICTFFFWDRFGPGFPGPGGIFRRKSSYPSTDGPAICSVPSSTRCGINQPICCNLATSTCCHDPAGVATSCTAITGGTCCAAGHSCGPGRACCGQGCMFTGEACCGTYRCGMGQACFAGTCVASTTSGASMGSVGTLPLLLALLLLLLQ